MDTKPLEECRLKGFSYPAASIKPLCDLLNNRVRYRVQRKRTHPINRVQLERSSHAAY